MFINGALAGYTMEYYATIKKNETYLYVESGEQLWHSTAT